MANDTSIGGASLDFTVDGSQAGVALDNIEDKAGRVDAAAGRAAAALGGIGDQAGGGAQKAERATRQLQASIERATAAAVTGGKGTAAFFESLAKQRGASVETLRPFLDQLAKVRDVQAEVALAAQASAEKQRTATAAVAENRRAFEQETAVREAYLARLREEAKLLGMSEAAQRSYRAALANKAAGGGAEGEELLRQLERVRSAQERAAQAARERADAERRAAATAKADDAFIASLEREAAAAGKTRLELLELDLAQRGLTARGAASIAKLREYEKGLLGVGVSAGQTRAALAQLPAQFTDIGTSLAGGMNPLLVLIQQGGQIRDSFGGFGNALKGIAEVVKPAYVGIGLLGGAVAAVTLAYAKGAAEQDEFARGLILSGNAVGKTVGGMDAMAQAISKVAGTRGKAAEALNALVSAGGVAGGALEKAAQAAIRLERVGGPAVEETVKQFSELGKEPLQAAVKLNEKTGFLTRSVYEQIKALEQSGNVAQAARVAQLAYADAVEGRTAQLEARLGTFERAWRALGDTAKLAWDKMLNIGRPETIEDAVAKAEASLDGAQKRLAGGGRRGGTTAELRGGGNAAEVLAAQDLLDTQREGLRIAERIADNDAGRVAQTKARADTESLVTASLSSQARLAKELESTRTKMELAGRDPQQIQAALAAITQGSSAFAQSIEVQLAVMRNAASEMVRAAQETGSAIESQFRRGLLSEVEYIERSRDSALQANAARIEETAKELAIVKQRRESTAQQIALQGRLNELLAEQAKISRDADNKVAENRAKLNRSAEQSYAGEREQGAQERSAFEVAEAARRNAISQSISDQARAQQDANAELALEASLIGKSASARSVALQQLRIQLALQREIEKIQGGGFSPDERDQRIEKATANAKTAIDNVASKATVDYLADLLDPTRAQTFGEALNAAFAGAGNSLAKLTNALQDYGTKQSRLNDAFSQNSKEKDPAKRLEQENRLIEAQGRLQISTYASMAGAAKGFFDENSKGYKALHAAETAFQAFQLASDLVKGVSAAAVGIANQAQGDPYTALPRMAVMAAAMAALGFATGFLGSSGGGSQASSAQRQGGAATGRIVTPDQLDRNSANYRGGTVFGDDEARSESIAKSIELLEDHARLELDYSRNALSALESIRDSMAGVANLVVRSVGGGLTTGKNLGIQTGTLSVNQGDPLAKALGLGGFDKFVGESSALFGGIGKALHGLWGKVTQEVVDSGIAVIGSVAELIAGQGVEQYADVKTTTSSFFGLKKKSTESTVFADVEDALAQQFGLIFKNIGDTIKSSADVLGREGGDALAAAIASFPVAIERLSLKGLKGEDLEEAISAAIGAQSDILAKTLLPGLEDFQTVGEGYFETLIKVASGIEVAGYELDLLGISAVKYTDVIRTQGDVGAEIVRQSIAAAETAGGALSSIGTIVNTLSGSAEDLADTYSALVDVRTALIKVGESGETLTTAMIRGAGGLDNLAGSLETYFTEFFSEQEQAAANASALATEFARIGVAMPLSRDEFRDLVTALNDGTDAGAAAAAKVLGLAGAFDEVADAAEEAASRLTDSIGEAVSRFGTPDERRGSVFGQIAGDLQRDAGVSLSIGQLMGASREEIEAFARSFLAVTTNSVLAKAAVLDAAAALADLRDQASGQRGTMEIELLRAQGRELEAVQRERRAELDQLTALEVSLGVAAGTFTKLQTEIYGASDAAAALAKQQSILSGVDGVIADFLKGDDLAQYRAARIQQTLAKGGINVSTEQIIGATTDGIVALWQSVGDAGKQAILDSYGALNTLQTDLTKNQRKALEDQLAGMKGLRDLAKDIAQFTAKLKFGDLSPLSAQAQLDQARALFDTTFTKAAAGDTKAQGDVLGNAQDYLKELQEAFASGPGYTREFERVTGLLDALGLQGEALDPQIEYLESLSDNSRSMLDALLSIDSTLKGTPGTGIGDRDYTAGPDGSSGGLSGSMKSERYINIPDSLSSRGADTGLQVELLQQQVKQLGDVVARLDKIAASSDANARIDQAGLQAAAAQIEALRAPMEDAARSARMADAKARAMPAPAGR